MEKDERPRSRFLFEYDGPHRFNHLSVLAINEKEAIKRAKKLRPNTNIKRLKNFSKV